MKTLEELEASLGIGRPESPRVRMYRALFSAHWNNNDSLNTCAGCRKLWGGLDGKAQLAVVAAYAAQKKG